MGKNEFLKKRDERDQTFFEAGRDVGFQQCLDYVFNALRDPELVKTDIWGEGRLVALHNLLVGYDRKFHGAWDARDKMADYLQKRTGCKAKRRLTTPLRSFYGEIPLYERYQVRQAPKGLDRLRRMYARED